MDVLCGSSSDHLEASGFHSIQLSPSSDIAALVGDDQELVLWNMLLQKPLAKITISLELARLPNLMAFRERPVYGDPGMVRCTVGC